MLGRRSLVSLEGREYRRMRALWSPRLTSSAIRTEHAAPIARYASAFADRVSTTSAVDILEAMSLITMCTATLILLGEKTEKQADEFAACAYKMLETDAGEPAASGLAPGLLNAHVFLEARSRMRSTIAEVLKRSRGAEGNGSFLARLAKYRDPETGRGFTRSELIDTQADRFEILPHSRNSRLSSTASARNSRWH
jgi:cytochrome P450